MLTYLNWNNLRVKSAWSCDKGARDFMPNAFLSLFTVPIDILLLTGLFIYIEENIMAGLVIGLAVGFIYAKNQKTINSIILDLLKVKSDETPK